MDHVRTVRWAAGAALALLAVLPYAGALRHPLLHDDRTLLDNAWMMRDADLPAILGHDYWYGTRHAGSDLYRPLTVMTLAWNLREARGPAPFRGVNLALHVLVVLTVWWVLDRLLRRAAARGARAPDPGAAPPDTLLSAAWIGAALFAVHPLCSEAVLFAVGRAELLAAGFGLLGFALLIEPGGRAGARVVLSAMAFALALLSKESAAAWIAILAIWWIVARGTGRDPGRAPEGLAAWSATLVAFLGARGAVVGWLPRTPPWIDNPLVLEGFAGRVLNAVRVQAIYLGKMVFPARLSVDHGYDQIAAWPVFPWGLGAALVVVAGWVAVAVALRRLSPVALFLWAFIPAAFAVTGNFLFPIGTILAERLAYLPLVGFCGLAGCLAARLSATRTTILALLLVTVPPAILRTADRTRDLRNHGTFVEATAAASPRAVKALANAGRSRLRSGRAREALEPLERAVSIWPDYRRALGLLADAWTELGDPAQAARYREQQRAAADRELAFGGPPPPR